MIHVFACDLQFLSTSGQNGHHADSGHEDNLWGRRRECFQLQQHSCHESWIVTRIISIMRLTHSKAISQAFSASLRSFTGQASWRRTAKVQIGSTASQKGPTCQPKQRHFSRLRHASSLVRGTVCGERERVFCWRRRPVAQNRSPTS